MAKKAAAAAPAPAIGLDDSPAVDRVRQGDQGRPYCEKHLCLMKATSSPGGVTYYKCPAPNCTCSQKQARPIARIPAEPRHCPQRICAGNDASYLEVDPEHSNGLTLLLKCPTCGHTQPEPRPTAHALLERQRQQAAEEPAEDYAAR